MRKALHATGRPAAAAILAVAVLGATAACGFSGTPPPASEVLDGAKYGF